MTGKSSGGYRKLALAVLRQAVQDVYQRGSQEAMEYLLSADCAAILEMLGADPGAVQREIRVRLERSQTSPAAGDRKPAEGEWVDVHQASQISGYNPEYLRQLVRRGKIRAIKLGWSYRLCVEDLHNYREQQQGL